MSPFQRLHLGSLHRGLQRGLICGLLATALVAGCGFVAAQDALPGMPSTADVPAVVFVPPRDPPVPLMWKVSDADNAVYLLGSFHLLKPDDYPLSHDVNQAFADSSSVAFELPPAEMESPQLALQMMQAALRPDGTLLQQELPAGTFARLQAWQSENAASLQGAGLTLERMQLFEPWFVGLMVSVTEMGKQGLDAKLGLDRHFMEAAAAAGKPTSGFETGAEQIELLDGMNRDEQLQFLDEALTEAADDDSLDTLHDAWRRGDGAAIEADMATDMQAHYPKLYQRINVERNDRWVPKIEAMLAQPGTDDTLVVVGTLHLLGSDGVVEKLRAAGYVVERICSACTDRPSVAAVNGARDGAAVAEGSPIKKAMPPVAMPAGKAREAGIDETP